MVVLSIDLETYSSVDLKSSGIYAYVEALDFEILLFGYAFDDEPVIVVDLARGERLPKRVLEAFTDPGVTMAAHNAQFERTCIARYFGIPMPPERWECTMALAYSLSLPGSLEMVAKILKLPEQKMSADKFLIRYFCVPAKTTKANGGRTRNLPQHDPVKWQTFKEYCGQDVTVERNIRRVLSRFPLPEIEQQTWALDQQINARGIRIDTRLVAHAIACDKQYQKRLEAEAIRLTGLPNPGSVSQLKSWLLETEDIEVECLNKETVLELLTTVKSDTVKRMLQLRQEMSKTSIKKYLAMERSKCQDDRVRGLFQYYGGHTGRWSSRLFQPQNLPKNVLGDLDLARQLLKAGDYELLDWAFGTTSLTLSQLIRTALIPAEGCRFLVGDFSAIEARITAWLANEQWRIDVFNNDGQIYEASAAAMFRVPIERIKKGNPEYALRAKGKVSELACGFGGGVGALIKMGALKMGLKEDELLGIIKAWRKASPKIVEFWWAVGDVAMNAVQERRAIQIRQLVFSYESGILFIRLPSGRRLSYPRPRIELDPRFNRDVLTYEGTEQTTKQWGRIKTYGPRLVENIVQAIARDCLRDALLRLDVANYRATLHVHDEIVCETPIGFGSMKEMLEIMGQPPSWAPGLPMNADGFEGFYYKKDD